MKYLEINNNMPIFGGLTLDKILIMIKIYSSSYFWSIQIIDGVGDIENIIGMNMVELEKYCDNSEQGFITDIDTIINFALACDDIVDVVVIACKNMNGIPKAYKDEGWEDVCEVIISREDSTLWQLTSKNDQIMKKFYSLIGWR